MRPDALTQSSYSDGACSYIENKLLVFALHQLLHFCHCIVATQDEIVTMALSYKSLGSVRVYSKRSFHILFSKGALN